MEKHQGSNQNGSGYSLSFYQNSWSWNFFSKNDILNLYLHNLAFHEGYFPQEKEILIETEDGDHQN